MTVDAQTEVVIDQPVERVAGYAADPSNAPEWYANIDAVEWMQRAMRRANSKDLQNLKRILEPAVGP